MKDNKRELRNDKMNFFDWLQLLFIAFKLAHIINWSWIWVLTPLWGGMIFYMIVFLVYEIHDAIKPLRK